MNHHHTCHVADCHTSRLRFGRYCRTHARRLNRYGHVNGRDLPKASLAPFAAQARRILLANLDHPGVSRAIDELQRLLNDASERCRQGLALNHVDRHWSRLANHNVDALTILSAAAGVVLFDRDDPRYFAMGHSFAFAIARAVLTLAPLGDMPRGSRTLVAIGSHMIDRYSELILAIVNAAAATEEDEKRRAEAMKVPLRIAPPTTTTH